MQQQNTLALSKSLLGILMFFLTLLPWQAQASHIAGGDISYECLNACTTRIHLRGYRDCTGSSSVSNVITFTPTTPGCTAPAPVAAWSSALITELNAMCPGISTWCTTPGATINGIEEHYFIRDYDICGVPTCTFDIHWSQCCRTPSLNSLINPGSQTIWVTLRGFTTNPTQCNSSPLFDHEAIPYICVGQSYVFPQGATDPDGDSLSYELAPCMQMDTVAVNYAVGYSGTQPLGPSWNVQINAMNGDISFTPLPGYAVTGVLCILIREWRSGVQIGSITRDVNVTAIPCLGMCGSNYVEGMLFQDDNNNCIPDPGEAPMALGQVSINSGAGILMSNYQGIYRGWLPAGTYVLEPLLSNNGLHVTTCPVSGSYTVTFPSINDTSLNNDFAREAMANCPNLNISIGSGPMRSCFPMTYVATYHNDGTDTAFNAYAEVELPWFQTYTSSSLQGATLLGNVGNVYTFGLGTVPHGVAASFQFNVTTSCDTGVIGNTGCIEAHIHPDTSCLPPHPNWDQSSVEVEEECVGDSLVCFTVTNTGQNMQGGTDWTLYENGILLAGGTLTLCGGCDTTLCFPANGHTFHFTVEQRPHHPGYSNPNGALELCGSPHHTEGAMTWLPLDDLDDFVDISCREVTNSYDPNTKHVNPTGVDAAFHYIDSTAVLTYFIDFQNTGTADALRVLLEDSLDTRLDILSIQPGPSSHPYTFQVLSGRRLQFTFDNINLPPQSQSADSSIGWVQYTVRQVAGNTFGDEIHNNCDIFFDMNLPIRTNTVLNTIGWPQTPVRIEEAGVKANVSVWPNPAMQSVYARVSGMGLEDGLEIEVFSLMGQRVFAGNFQAEQTYSLDLKGLSRGVYVYRVSAGGVPLRSGRIVLQ
jgi:uncharacterized repeat protein (TIGR01451 family)